MSGISSSGGLVVVDKPAGWTSHDVVGRLRRLAGTRKVGHAGTLDPMATGVLLIGIGRATRLLGHLQLADKAYTATIRLGQATSTDDAEGEVLTTTDAAGVTETDVRTAMAGLTGEVEQVPSSVSAIKVDGRRAYARVRAGESVELPARAVRVSEFVLRTLRRDGETVDLDVDVECSTGTYVRALARDLGRDLGVGGHLTALRRTRVGGFTLGDARTLDALADDLVVLSPERVARTCFPTVVLDEPSSREVRHGRILSARALPAGGPVALLGPDGRFLALYEQHGPDARAVAVFAPA